MGYKLKKSNNKHIFFFKISSIRVLLKTENPSQKPIANVDNFMSLTLYPRSTNKSFKRSLFLTRRVLKGGTKYDPSPTGLLQYHRFGAI